MSVLTRRSAMPLAGFACALPSGGAQAPGTEAVATVVTERGLVFDAVSKLEPATEAEVLGQWSLRASELR